MEKNTKTYGINWLIFYVKWRFPIGFIFGAISIVVEIAVGAMSGYFSVSAFYPLLLLDIAVYLFRIPVYENLIRLTQKGYEFNNILLVIESIFMIFTGIARSGIRSLSFGLLAGTPMVALIWWLPNFIYFRHRKPWFTGEKTLNELIAERKQTAAVPQVLDKTSPAAAEYMAATVEAPVAELETKLPPIRFCRACGKSLPTGSQFCAACGAKVILPVPIASVAETISSEPAQSLPTAPADEVQDLTLSTGRIDPPFRRAFLLMEDAEWEKADTYLERVLDSEPENAYAYLGKAMLDLKAVSMAELVTAPADLNSNKNYAKAVRFADPDLKHLLTILDNRRTSKED